MKRTAVPFLIAFAILLIPYPSSSSSLAPKGILVRPQKTIQAEEDVDNIINLCEKYDITHIFLMVKQDTGPESGAVYYTSTKAPRISDFDVLSRFLEKADKKEIKVYAWLPLLYDHLAVEAGFGITEDWVSPLQSESYYADLVNEIEMYPVDGILFDYLRFPDDFAATEQLLRDFGNRFGYDMDLVDLALEQERATSLWDQWIWYRKEILTNFLNAVVPESVPAGVTVIPQDLPANFDFFPFPMVDFVAGAPEGNPEVLINQLTLFTKADTYCILPNDYIRNVRQLISKIANVDLLIFDSDLWDESDFKRIEKAEIPFDQVQMIKLPFIDFFNEQYTMEKWRSHEINTVVLPAGRVFWTYFKYVPYKEKWSLYTGKYDRDFVREMIAQAEKNGLYVVLELNIQSEEYVTKHKDAASITYEWRVMRNRVCLSELNRESYRKEFFEMAKFLADNYEAEALLVTNLSYLEDCFCTDCLDSYVNFMSERGTILEDWPRENGEINIYDQTIREWKTAQTIQFLSELRQYLRNSNKELWVEVPVSANLEDASSEYGLHLPELENVADRIVLTAIDVKNPPRVERLANSLSSSRYILNFFIDSETPLARTYLLDSLKAAYGNGISNVGVYPHTALTDSLWGAFYIGYVYHFALGREELQELYDTGDYQSVISEYFALEEEEKEEKEQFREKAYVNIRDAETSYANVLANLEEAEQVDLDVTASEITLQYDLELLSEARRLFVEGNYEEAEKKGETAIVEFSTLGRSIENLVKEERIKRVTSGVTIIVVFLLIIAILRFRVKRKK